MNAGRGRRALLAAATLAALCAAIVIVAVVLARRGDGACYAGDPTLPSQAADPALLAGIPRVPGAGLSSVEIVNGQMLGGRAQVIAEPGTLLSFSGWAVDAVTRTLPRAVLVALDGTAPLRADTCIRRVDVARFFSNPVYERAGYAARLRVLPGVHEVTIGVLSADGRTFSSATSRFAVEAHSPHPVASAPFVVGGFTLLDGNAIAPAVFAGGAYSHVLGTDLLIGGWMIDRTEPLPITVRAVDVLLDGRVVDRAAYGSVRPDVAAFIKAPELLNSGFTARVLTDDLHPGRHRLGLRGILADGRPATLAATIAIDLRRAAPTGR